MSEKKKLAWVISIVSVCVIVTGFTIYDMLDKSKPPAHGDIKTDEMITELKDEEKQKVIDEMLDEIQKKKNTFEESRATVDEYVKKTTEMATEVDSIMESGNIKSYDRCITSSEAEEIFETAEDFLLNVDTLDEEVEDVLEEAEDLDKKIDALEDFLGKDGYITETQDLLDKITKDYNEFEFGHAGRVDEANEKKKKALAGESIY